MFFKGVKRLSIIGFSLFLMFFSMAGNAQTGHEPTNPETEASTQRSKKKTGFDANEVIFGHVLDAHEFHFLSYEGKDGEEHSVAIPLPIILYSPQKGWSFFMASQFEEGHKIVDGYKLQGPHITSVEPGVKVYDFSLTRNVVQMFIALALFVWVMLSVAKKYKQNPSKAPSGMQNAMEVVINFLRDDIAKPNLGHKYEKYMPYLLTVFFFILINSLVGMIPGTANVTGNIAFTMILSLISFVVIMFSSNKHYWGHIVNPPVPWYVKPIMFPVEVLGIFTKPFALMIRLFANMLAGHIIIICLISMIFIFGALSSGVGWGFSPISIGFSVFIYFIEILVAFIQAYIFANLTAVFIGQAMEGSHDEHDHLLPPHSMPEYNDPIMV